MINRHIRTISIFLTVPFVLGLFGCSKEEAPETSETTVIETTAETTTVPSPTPTPTPEPKLTKITKHYYHDDQLDPFYYFEYFFDEDLHLTEFYLNYEKSSLKTSFTYEDSSVTINEVTYIGDERNSSETYIFYYDGFDKLDKTLYDDSFIYLEYDDSGILLRDNIYDYTFEETNNGTKVIAYRTISDDEYLYYEYLYNDNGVMIGWNEIENYDYGHYELYVSYEYDDMQRLIKETWDMRKYSRDYWGYLYYYWFLETRDAWEFNYTLLDYFDKFYSGFEALSDTLVIENEYDDEGFLTKKTETWLDKDGNEVDSSYFKYEYTYDN